MSKPVADNVITMDCSISALRSAYKTPTFSFKVTIKSYQIDSTLMLITFVNRIFHPPKKIYEADVPKPP